MNNLFLDFESVYDSKNGFGLGSKKLSIVEYIRDPRFHAFGFAAAHTEMHPKWVSHDDIPNVLKSVDWDNTALVGHNVKFDAAILYWKYGYLPKQFIDTLAMARAILGKSVRSHSLDSLSEHFKLERKGHLNTDGKYTLTPGEEKDLADYCVHDVELCQQVYSNLRGTFPRDQYATLDQTIRMFVQPKLQLNVDLLQKASEEEATRRANIFIDIKIDKKEFASNVKFPELLKKEGYEVPMKSSTRKVDDNGEPIKIPALALGDEEFLDMLESEDERLRTLCEARVAAKSTLLETRSAKMAKIGATGLWPFDIEFSGADQTHRFSGGSGSGGNPQNFTRGSALREAVEAPEGYELVVGDFSNIELRLVAYLSKDPGLVGAIEKGSDIYCDFASVFYNRTITKADKKERQFGKTAILGLGYGCGWAKFQKMVRIQTGESISEEDARKAVDLYRTRYARVPALWEALDNGIAQITKPSRLRIHNLPVTFGCGVITLPSGLNIRFPMLHQQMGERGYSEWVYEIYRKGRLEKSKLYGGKVLENISQGLAGELCKEAMVRMGQDVVMQIHDELGVVCKKGLASIVAAKLKRAMSISPDWLPEIKLDAEVGVGKNWMEAK